MVPLRMRPDDAHCGPVAISWKSGKTPEEIMSCWPDKWTNPRNDRKYYVWPIDTPWNHKIYIEKVLGKQMLPLTVDDPWFPPGAIALIHNFNWGKNFVTRFIGSLLFQHWVVILNDDGQQITVDWGTEVNPIRVYDRPNFLRYLSSGWPTCVYTIV